jgi:TonB family protein
MRKIAAFTTFILLLLISFQSFGKKIYLNSEWEHVKKKKNATFYYTTSEISESENYNAKVFYLDGKLYCEGEFNTKKISRKSRNGKITYYYYSGLPMCKIEFKNGDRHGYWEVYYDNGVLEKKGNYHTGNLVGTWYYYSIDNELEETKSFPQKSFTGTFTVYYSDSTIQSIANYKNGMRHGDFKSYYKSGTIKSKGKYVNTLFEGKWEYFDTNSKPVSCIFYDSAITPDSATYFYYEDSVMRSKKLINDKTIDQFPEFLDPSFIITIIRNNLIYPSLAIEHEIQGKVYVSATISSTGKIKKLKIVHPIKLDFGLEQECLRVFRKHLKLKPHSIFNVGMSQTVVIPVSFKLL